MIRGSWRAGVVALACTGVGADVPAADSGALETVLRASQAMGVPALDREGFVQWSFTGTYDESVERGGFEPEPPAIVKDTFAVDLERQGAGWDSEGRRGDGSVRWRRFLYPEPELLLRVDVPARFAAATRSLAYRSEQPRVARAIPQMLLKEAATRPGALRSLGPVLREGVPLGRIEYTTATGDAIELLIDPALRLARVELPRALPFVGERRIAWAYADWMRDRGVLVPRRLSILVGDEPLRVLALTSVTWDRTQSIFVLPEGTPPPGERPGPAKLPPAPLAPSARLVAPDVWLAPDVRPGINGYFMLLPDGVTAFEAPAGFLYPQIEIPPPDLARGRGASEPGEAFVDLIQRTLPGKPIRRVVVSHAHADHAGGVRAFAAAGAEIVVPRGAAPPVRRFLGERFVLAADRWERARDGARVVVREVDSRETFGDGAQRLEVLRVGPNPHSDAMAIVWLPGRKIVLQGDLFYADPIESFPSPGRVTIMRWFAGWIERQGLAPERIYGTHSELPATREHLEKLARTPAEP